MARTSNIMRDRKRQRLIEHLAPKRAALLQIMRNPELDPDERIAAQKKLQKMPRNSSATRLKNRCNLCGRPRAYHRRVGLCRLCFRACARRGLLPGVLKASW